MFCSPPPRPGSSEDWPTISDVILKIHNELGDEYYVTVTEDVIVAVPPSAKSPVSKYAQDVATEKWNQSNIERGIELAIKGLFDKLGTDQNKRILKKLGLYPVARKMYNMFIDK